MKGSDRLALLLFLGAFLCFSAGAQPREEQREIALTFEGLPAVKPLGYWRPREVSNMILRFLAKQKISAMGFVVAERVDDDPSTWIVLEDWVTHGHLLGNQTYGNVDFNQLGVDDFLDHVRDGGKMLWKLSKAHRFNYKNFRFPLLHEGITKSRRNDVLKVLKRAGYRVVPVTIKTSDQVFDGPYIDNEAKPERIGVLKKLYLEHVESSLKYSEEQSRKVFNHLIPQILQLHCGIATASFLPDLVQFLQQRGYRFISVDKALSDPAFKAEDIYAGPLGLTFIDRIAASRNLPFDAGQGDLRPDQLDEKLSSIR